jgi:hypothetical protein
MDEASEAPAPCTPVVETLARVVDRDWAAAQGANTAAIEAIRGSSLRASMQRIV